MTPSRSTTAYVVAAAIVTIALSLLGNMIAGNPDIIPWLSRWNGHPYATISVVFAALALISIAVAVWQRGVEDAAKGSTANDAAGPSGTLRTRLLERVMRDRIEPRLQQGLRGVGQLGVTLYEVPDQVRPRLRIYSEIESGSSQPRRIDSPILTIFQHAASERLLILGEPGTGKTNLLLELARDLVAVARKDETQPIPLVFSLPRWTLSQNPRTLAQWIVDDLGSEYGVSRKTAVLLLEQCQILPLLDGLDEVAEEYRNRCVEAINSFHETNDLKRIAVCCRAEDYRSLIQLDLQTAVRIEKLTRTDIEEATSDPQMAQVRLAFEEDPGLWELIDTPLWLHVLYGASQVSTVAVSHVAVSHVVQGRQLKQDDPRYRLYARYVEYAIQRDAYGFIRRQTPRKIFLASLGWLAAAMRNRNQSQFACEDLNAYWLVAGTKPSPITVMAILWYFPIYLLACEATMGIGLDIISAAHFSWWYLLYNQTALLFFAWFSFSETRPEPAEETTFSLKIYPILLAINFGSCLVIAIMVWRWSGMKDALLCGGLLFFFNMLWYGFGTRELSERSIPNAGTTRSLKRAAFFGGMAAILLFFHLPHFGGRVAWILGLTYILTRILFVLLFWREGGAFVITHFTTRALLRVKGCLPLQLVRFLNEASNRLFLIRQGSTYVFVHATFRDFMADTYGPAAKVRRR